MSWMLDHRGGCSFFFKIFSSRAASTMGRARVGGSEDYCGTLADRVGSEGLTADFEIGDDDGRNND
jgi:hypothetical protein